MKNMIKWEKGDRVTRDGIHNGTVGNMAEPVMTHILPDGAQSWVLRWWVRWDANPQEGVKSPWMDPNWGSDLTPALLDSGPKQ